VGPEIPPILITSYLLPITVVMEVKIEVNFVSAKKMRDLNKELRGQDYTPAVLAFPYYEPVEEGMLLGEVLICKSEARRLAKRGGVDEDEQIGALIIHGIENILRGA